MPDRERKEYLNENRVRVSNGIFISFGSWMVVLLIKDWLKKLSCATKSETLQRKTNN